MNWNKSLFLILTNDEALKDTLGAKLNKWGAEVFYLEIGDISPSPHWTIDVALIDIRQKATEALRYFNTVKTEMPFAEILTVNRSGNICASIEGMRSGAGDELLVPFDTENLREKINEALARSRKRQKNSKRSFFSVFGDAMNAATFAQAGEFKTALEILDGSSSGTKERRVSERKEPAKNMKDSDKEKEKK